MKFLRAYESARDYAVGMTLQDKKRLFPPISLVSESTPDVINGVRLERWVCRGPNGCVTVDERLLDMKFDVI